jgi:hypothetical protein
MCCCCNAAVASGKIHGTTDDETTSDKISSTGDWRFLSSAPPHYTTLRLQDGETIELDGRLDDAAWSARGVEWTTDLVDITRHNDTGSNIVPSSMQMRAKVRGCATLYGIRGGGVGCGGGGGWWW